jgi:hypothetical protein
MGILQLTDHNWTIYQPRRFFSHSFSSPTPSISTLQALGLCTSKSFVAHTHLPPVAFVITPLHIFHIPMDIYFFVA